MQKKCDIAIIGAGIGGLYTAYRLKKDPRTQGKNIMIFEATDRLGGRIETVRLGEFYAEAGSMRIEPELQIILNNLIKELNLETIDTFENYGVTKIPKKDRTPLQVLYSAISQILNVGLEEMKNFNRNDFVHIYTKAKYKDKFLWEMGWWEVLSDVLNYSSIKYVMSRGHFYHFIHENLSAAAEIVFFLRVLKTNYRLKNIKGGMHNLITKLEKLLIKNQTTIERTHKLIHFENIGNDILLKFSNDTLLQTKELILTLPLPNLIELASCFPEKIQKTFSCAKNMQLLKVMFLIKNPWWPKKCEANYQAFKIPTRELHYYNGDDETGMIMIYTDSPFTLYWRSLISNEPQFESRLNQDEALVKHFCKFFPCSTNHILEYAVRDWGKAPYYGALSFWDRGHHLGKIIKIIRSFRLDNSATKKNNIYICNDTYTDYPGFIEGSLRSSDEVIELVCND